MTDADKLKAFEARLLGFEQSARQLNFSSSILNLARELFDAMKIMQMDLEMLRDLAGTAENSDESDPMIPFLAVGNDELGETFLKKGDVECPNVCGRQHKVILAKKEDGTETDILMSVKCGTKAYIVGIGGKRFRK